MPSCLQTTAEEADGQLLARIEPQLFQMGLKTSTRPSWLVGPPLRRTEPSLRLEAENPYCPAEQGEQLVCEAASLPSALLPSAQLTQAALLD